MSQFRSWLANIKNHREQKQPFFCFESLPFPIFGKYQIFIPESQVQHDSPAQSGHQPLSVNNHGVKLKLCVVNVLALVKINYLLNTFN